MVYRDFTLETIVQQQLQVQVRQMLFQDITFLGLSDRLIELNLIMGTAITKRSHSAFKIAIKICNKSVNSLGIR